MSINTIVNDNAPPLPPRTPIATQPGLSSITVVSVSDDSSHDSHRENSAPATAPPSTSQSHSGSLPSTSTLSASEVTNGNVKLQEQTQTLRQTGPVSSSTPQPSTYNNGPLSPLPQLQLPWSHDDGFQGLDTTRFRRSLDGQRPTVPILPLNSDTPPNGQVPSAITVTLDHPRPISTSAPASASTSVPTSTSQEHLRNWTPQEHQYLSSQSSLPYSHPNSNRVSTSSISTTVSNPPTDDPGPSRISLEQQPPPYSLAVGSHGSSTMIATVTHPTEEHLFQVQELTPPPPTVGSTSPQAQYICANPMHDQQYLLVGSGNALHSIDLTLPLEKQTVRTHIQGLAFKEIHCLEDIGLVVVIAGRNSRVRCYDYDSIKRLVSYGYSKEGQGRVVEGGKLGAMKNMIQLRVETAIMKDENQGADSPCASPVGQSIASRILKGPSPSTTPQPLAQVQIPNRHEHLHSIDRSSLLSPPLRSDSPGTNFDFRGSGDGDPNSDGSTAKKHKQRPLSFAGLASLAQEHVMRNKGQQQSSQIGNQQGSGQASKAAPPVSSSTPTSPSSSSGAGVTKNKRLSQMASYFSQAAVNSNMAVHVTSGQDAPSEEAVDWAWDFTKMKQTKDVLGLDFHYTISTVYMTVLSKTGIDIYSRSKAARGRKPGQTSSTSASSGYGPASDDTRRSMIGGIPSAPRDSLSAVRDSPSFYEWRLHKQFYHPEAPSFMTVVKDPQEVTDIILGKGTRACIINVDTMSVNDIHRQANNASAPQGISKKLGFKNNQLWHSFEKIPFDVPPYILYPETAAAIFNARRDTKERYIGDTSDPGRRSRGDIIQRPSDQQSIQQLEDQEKAATIDMRLQQAQSLGANNASGSLTPSSMPNSNSPSSLFSPSPTPAQQQQQQTMANTQLTAYTGNVSAGTSNSNSGGGGTKASKKTRMVTSDEVLNMAFCQRTTTQLFLATFGSQSRIVDIQGKPQSPIILDWELPPQKVEFLKTDQDIYVIGFEKSCITVYSLTRAKKVKEIWKNDLIQSASVAAAGGEALVARGNRVSIYENIQASTSTNGGQTIIAPSPTSLPAGVAASINSPIKFLGRDNIADESLGIFFSYCHPRNGTSICKLGLVPLARNDLELVGYHH
ncbi:hypothetical protein BGZ80_000047 [Entomortierella chlamydospora]|uniref:CNH domain-containing protein n=1 Tax=Entomortierella chlamydospora TaxID=101097 RepID=A0A9P6MSZ1_9FUNG|nr:hypothetical protein BGZ79_010848 [Entomortierella chlamydospora]KAG0012327.1 hypothetical protein BGZ80_000047 [Entomortierella chlamydospora]